MVGSNKSIVVCISPLVSIMIDQHEKFSRRGLKTEFVYNTHLMEEESAAGGCAVGYFSPESLINN